jgi:hypothetical protein
VEATFITSPQEGENLQVGEESYVYFLHGYSDLNLYVTNFMTYIAVMLSSCLQIYRQTGVIIGTTAGHLLALTQLLDFCLEFIDL